MFLNVILNAKKQFELTDMKRLQRFLLSFISFLLVLHPKGPKIRMKLFRRFHVFGSLGEKCIMQDWKLPLYTNLIHLHNNIRLAKGAIFTTHDGTDRMLNHKFGGDDFEEKCGCIEIMDNVFVGAHARIMLNTRIGSNVIIGANSVVTKDIPDNSVYAGAPAKFICNFDDYVKKHKDYSEKFRQKYGKKEWGKVSDKLAKQLYEDFKKARE